MVPVHTKDKKNYRLISYYLTSFFSKIIERVIHNSLLIHFVSTKLFTPSQFGFLPRDSYITQILTITHEIPPDFDSDAPFEFGGVFLDLSKAFYKV